MAFVGHRRTTACGRGRDAKKPSATRAAKTWEQVSLRVLTQPWWVARGPAEDTNVNSASGLSGLQLRHGQWLHSQPAHGRPPAAQCIAPPLCPPPVLPAPLWIASASLALEAWGHAIQRQVVGGGLTLKFKSEADAEAAGAATLAICRVARRNRCRRSTARSRCLRILRRDPHLGPEVVLDPEGGRSEEGNQKTHASGGAQQPNSRIMRYFRIRRIPRISGSPGILNILGRSGTLRSRNSRSLRSHRRPRNPRTSRNSRISGHS